MSELFVLFVIVPPMMFMCIIWLIIGLLSTF